MNSDLSPIGAAAVEYARMGLAIIPLAERGKVPVSKNGLNDWNNNAEDIADYWRDNPYANVAIVCGQPSHGLLVIDIDVDEEKGEDGYATLRQWEITHGELPKTATAITGRGGMHLLYYVDASRGEIRPSTNPDAGVDIRCAGSYIVAPPSIHPNGNRYEWQDPPDETPIAQADGNVYAFVDSVQRNGGNIDDVTKPKSEKFILPEQIKEGGRNDTLYRYGCSLRSRGRSDEEILNSLIGANMTRCVTPLDMTEIKTIYGQVLRQNEGEDRDNGKKIGKPGAGKFQPSEAEPWRTARGIRHDVLSEHLIQHLNVCSVGGAPGIWTGTRWDVGVSAINSACIDLAPDARSTVRNEVIKYILDRIRKYGMDREFDPMPYVQFKNGTYDMYGQPVEPTPNMFITNTLPIEFHMDAECEAVDSFLLSISNHDAATLHLLKQVIGAAMCSMRLTDQAVMLIGYTGKSGGEASNGKSTYLNALRRLLGTNNVSSRDIRLLGDKFQRQFLLGKLANIGDDIPNGYLEGSELAIFKQAVTGDTIFTDIKGAEGFHFVPSATFMFSMNEVPRLGDTSEGIFRRLAFLPFRRSFRPGDPDYDPLIINKITTPEALRRFALLGMQELEHLNQTRHFDEVPDMYEEVQEIRVTNDSVLRWIEDEQITLEHITERKKTTSEIYAEYTAWCGVSGEKNYVSKSTFSRKILKKFGEFGLCSNPVDGKRYYMLL